jgi:hypothetical protein
MGDVSDWIVMSVEMLIYHFGSITRTTLPSFITPNTGYYRFLFGSQSSHGSFIGSLFHFRRTSAIVDVYPLRFQRVQLRFRPHIGIHLPTYWPEPARQVSCGIRIGRTRFSSIRLILNRVLQGLAFVWEASIGHLLLSFGVMTEFSSKPHRTVGIQLQYSASDSSPSQPSAARTTVK